eukprot:gene1894-4988_t
MASSFPVFRDTIGGGPSSTSCQRTPKGGKLELIPVAKTISATPLPALRDVSNNQSFHDKKTPGLSQRQTQKKQPVITNEGSFSKSKHPLRDSCTTQVNKEQQIKQRLTASHTSSFFDRPIEKRTMNDDEQEFEHPLSSVLSTLCDNSVNFSQKPRMSLENIYIEPFPPSSIGKKLDIFQDVDSGFAMSLLGVPDSLDD